jgi:SRSO17 transposase
LEQFKSCVGHRAQLLSLRTYVQGVFSDSERKSMQAMLARVTEPVAYQAPERQGALILDSTSFPKQGPHSVGVARQYCGALGKIANCQVAVTAALWTGVRAWCLGAALYLPEEWLTREQRTAARIPATVRFESKWRQALRLVRQLRAAGFALTAVLADAEFGDVTTFRAALHRLHLPYALGISSHLTVFTTRPRVRPPPANRRGRPRTRLQMMNGLRPVAVRAVVAELPPTAWRRVTWRNGRQPRRTARFAAMRVTPAHEWRQARVAPEVWLLCEEERSAKTRLKYYFVALPATASLGALVRLAHQRWAIEQQYQELKSELGLDHFEGRSYPGWHHHVVLTAVAHAYIQRERMRRRTNGGLTFPAVRAIVQEIFTALLFAAKPRYMHWMEEAKRNLQLRI